MTTPLIIGAVRTVVLGPAYDTASPARGTTVAVGAVGLKVEMQVGDAAPVDITTNLIATPGDWYWRAVGTMGDHALDIPASYFVELNVGKTLRLNAHADGVQPFGNRESLIIVDAAHVTRNNQEIADLAAGGYRYRLNLAAVPPTISTIRDSDGVTVNTQTIELGERDPLLAVGNA